MGRVIPAKIVRARKAATPLTERVYSAIKEEILTNRLEPGAVLPVQRFAVEMKLSRTPVREAILRLEREGFVEVRPRLGTIVAPLDLRRLREMYHVRSVLEADAARLACQRLPDEIIEWLEKDLKRQRTSGAIDAEAVSDAGQRLHEAIIEHCGNSVLAETIRGLQDHFKRFRRVSLRLPEKVLASHREHIGILDALKRRHGDDAHRLVREHFEHAAHFLIDSLLGEPPRRSQPVTRFQSVR